MSSLFESGEAVAAIISAILTSAVAIILDFVKRKKTSLSRL